MERSTEIGQSEAGETTLARFELWPHRSLGTRGKLAVVSIAAAGSLLPLVCMPQPAATLPIAAGALVTVAALALALWRNGEAAKSSETIVVRPDKVHVTRADRRAGSRTMEFTTGWVRVDCSSDAHVDNRVTLRESGRRCSVGEFLSPDERVMLAGALSRSISEARQSCRGGI